MNRLKPLYSPRAVQFLMVITLFFFPHTFARTQTTYADDYAVSFKEGVLGIGGYATVPRNRAFQQLAKSNSGKDLGYVDRQEKSKSSSAIGTPGSDPWRPENIMSTEALAGIVKDAKSPQPVILYVGPAALYKRAHIPGAQFIGVTSKEEGLESLKKAAALWGKKIEIVVYCGCCPWEMCPNIRPAFQELQKLGYSKIRVLDLPNSFKQDWITKGFPIEKSE